MSQDQYHAQYLAARTYRREEVLAKPYPVPAEPGVYGWWFKTLPADIDVSNCIRRDDGLVLLYAGISPSKPSSAGVASKQNIRRRIKLHYAGDALVSTSRKSLGSLLSNELGIKLGRFGLTERQVRYCSTAVVGVDGRQRAGVLGSFTRNRGCEGEMIETVDLPQYIDGAHNPFRKTSKVMRRARWCAPGSLLVPPRHQGRGS